jgi:hypothetical protein
MIGALLFAGWGSPLRLLDLGREAKTARDRARDALRRKELTDPALSSGFPEGQAAEGIEGGYFRRMRHDEDEKPIPDSLTGGTPMVRPAAERITDLGGDRRGGQIPAQPLSLADLQRLESSTEPGGGRHASVWKASGKLFCGKYPASHRGAKAASQRIDAAFPDIANQSEIATLRFSFTFNLRISSLIASRARSPWLILSVRLRGVCADAWSDVTELPRTDAPDYDRNVKIAPFHTRWVTSSLTSDKSCRSVVCIRRIDIGELYALARFSHHLGNCIPPCFVVRGLFVGRRSFSGAVRLDQHEARRIIRLLKDVEARNP